MKSYTVTTIPSGKVKPLDCCGNCQHWVPMASANNTRGKCKMAFNPNGKIFAGGCRLRTSADFMCSLHLAKNAPQHKWQWATE